MLFEGKFKSPETKQKTTTNDIKQRQKYLQLTDISEQLFEAIVMLKMSRKPIFK